MVLTVSTTLQYLLKVAYIPNSWVPVQAKLGRRVLKQRPLLVASRFFNYWAAVSGRLVARSCFSVRCSSEESPFAGIRLTEKINEWFENISKLKVSSINSLPSKPIFLFWVICLFERSVAVINKLMPNSYRFGERILGGNGRLTTTIWLGASNIQLALFASIKSDPGLRCRPLMWELSYAIKKK